MRSVHMVLKHLVKPPVDIYGDAVSNITPSSDWSVCHQCKIMTVKYFHLDHVFVIGM